jgi:predicted aldo/keto reductase-like oxidoreductase
MGPLQAGLTPEEGGRLIRYALEQGVNVIDTAELYQTYPHIKEGLRGYGGEAIIISKTHAPDGALARAHVERGLRELGIDRFHVVHMHCAKVADPFVERRQVLDVLLAMKEEGKIAHVGLSSHYISAIRKAAEHPEIEVIHPLINMNGMGIIDGTEEEMGAAILACKAAGKGIYAMKALAGGNLIPQARQAIRYVLNVAGVDGVAIGMVSEAEIDANITLFETGAADDATWATLEKKRRRLRIMAQFCKGCGMCLDACGSGALTIVDGKAQVDEGACVLCGYCGASCPEFMIRVV